MILTDVATAIFTLTALWSIACRLAQMDTKETRADVIAQHLALAASLLLALFVPVIYAHDMLAGGVMLYLTLGAWRWRKEAPPGTLKNPPWGRQ